MYVKDKRYIPFACHRYLFVHIIGKLGKGTDEFSRRIIITRYLNRVGLMEGTSTFDPKVVGLNPGRAPMDFSIRK